MSRDLDAGKGKKSKTTERERYKPSEGGLEKELVDVAIDHFKEVRGVTDVFDFDTIYRPRLEQEIPADVNGKDYIDLVVQRIEHAGLFQLQYSDFLINSLAMLFHERGQNGFVVDMRRLTGVRGYAGYGLRGEPDRRLSITYLLPPTLRRKDSNVGTDSRHVSMVVEGKAYVLGQMSRDSSFFLDTTPVYVGHEAQDCDFYLEDWRDAAQNIEGAGSTLIQPDGTERTFRRGFFMDGNRIFYPVGNEWKELES